MATPVTPLPPAEVAPSMLRRIRDLLPPGWFAEPGDQIGTAKAPDPILESYLSGIANGIAGWIWWFLQYVTQQLYITTATGGWLDIASVDFFGDGVLPRYPGESDAAFLARIQANLFPPANTRSAIQNAVEVVTGSAARMIEPWDPRNNAVYGTAFYGVDGIVSPGNYSNGASRYQGFIEATLPAVTDLGDQPQYRFYDGAFYGNHTPAAGFYWNGPAGSASASQLVYNIINKLKSFGTTVWVRFLSPAEVEMQLGYRVVVDDLDDDAPLIDDLAGGRSIQDDR